MLKPMRGSKFFAAIATNANSARVEVDFEFSDLVSKDGLYLEVGFGFIISPQAGDERRTGGFVQIKLNLSQSIQRDNKPTKFT